MGTLFYIAPEMIIEQSVEFGADLWALGIIIYRLLTGQYLFKGKEDFQILEKIRQGNFSLDPSLNDNAKDLILNLLKMDPKSRIGNRAGFQELKQHAFFKEIDWEKDVDFLTVFPLQKY